MLNGADRCEYALDALERIGFAKAECTLNSVHGEELNLDSGKISLLRTTDDITLHLSGIRNGAKGSLSMNRTDERSMEEGAARAMELAESSEPDPAHDISPFQPAAEFRRGPLVADLDLMHERMKEFRQYTVRKYPSLILRRTSIIHESRSTHYTNTNGTDLRSRIGSYSIQPLFASKEGKATSSFNYATVVSDSLDRPFWEYGSLDLLMLQSTEQVRSTVFEGKFEGDIIITPECLQEFVDMVCIYLGDRLMVRGTSIFRDSLNERVADERLTLRSTPLSGELAAGHFITDDGFAAENSTVIESGILRSFLLSLYGARKTGRERVKSGGGCFVLDPGDTSHQEMVASVDRGVLLCRFSGGSPSAAGDFSGVAKNSYLIEEGEIRYPVKEMMISGSIRDLLRNIRAISAERVNMGYCLYPWVRAGGLTIFGR